MLTENSFNLNLFDSIYRLVVNFPNNSDKFLCDFLQGVCKQYKSMRVDFSLGKKFLLLAATDAQSRTAANRENTMYRFL
jgi:hypothetical protein